MTTETRVSRGSIVIGGMLVAIGVALLLDRTGVGGWPGQRSLWPLLLMGVGLARLVESPASGPYKGLVFIAGGAWLMAVQAGWLWLSTSWPLLIVALGVAIAIGGISRGQPGTDSASAEVRQSHAFAPLAILGIWVAIFMAGNPRGLLSSQAEMEDGETRIVHIIGNSAPAAPIGQFRKANVISVMGRTELDLRQATMAPGETATVEVFTMWGRTVLRVPRDWIVEDSARTLAAETKDERRTKEGLAVPDHPTPPRLIVRGVVTMGTMAIRY